MLVQRRELQAITEGAEFLFLCVDCLSPRSKAFFFNTKKFVAAASLVRSKKKSGLVGAGLGSCMMSQMMLMLTGLLCFASSG
jgi:hypothetical protein